MGRSKSWDGISYGRLEAPAHEARELFRFAGAWAPPPSPAEVAWGAWDEARLTGTLLLEQAGAAALLHGPVVVTPEGAEPDQALDIAAHLLAEALHHASGGGIEILYSRPQGLDRLWIRSGFVPLPEAELPRALRGRPGVGLFAWRGGSALLSMAGREISRAGRPGR